MAGRTNTKKSGRKLGVKILSCKGPGGSGCRKNVFQDALYNGKRVMNPTQKVNGGSEVYRCTVCNTERDG